MAGPVLIRAGLSPFTPVQGSEYVWELDCGAQATGWLTLQYIRHPDGVPTNPDAVAPGLKATLAL